MYLISLPKFSLQPRRGSVPHPVSEPHGGGETSGNGGHGDSGGIPLGSSAGAKDVTASSGSKGGGKSFALGKNSPFKGRRAGGGIRVSIHIAMKTALHPKQTHRTKFSGRLGTGAAILMGRPAHGWTVGLSLLSFGLLPFTMATTDATWYVFIENAGISAGD
jgi:hypothetical protein